MNMGLHSNPKTILDHLERRDFKSLRHAFKDFELADIAEVFPLVPEAEKITLFRLMPRLRRADLFAYLDFEQQAWLLEELPATLVSAFLNHMAPDDRTKLLEEFTEEIRAKVIALLDPEERQVTNQLLSYPEGSVGRLMTPDFLCLTEEMTVTQAVASIQWSNTLPLEYLHNLFVIKQNRQLIGEVTLAALVVCDPPTKKIAEVMRTCFVSLRPDQEEADAVELFRKYDRTYIPVVDGHEKIIGIVTSDDVFDIAEEEATEDIQQFGGHMALESSYFHTPLWTMLQKRAGWLVLLFVGGFFSGEALRHYESILTQWSFLMFFLPSIISAGGNSGTQAASLVIRELAISGMQVRDVGRVFLREMGMGGLLGLLLGGIGFLRAIFWGLSPLKGLVVAASVVLVVISGVLFGSMLPFVFRKLKLDPAVVSSPFISTLVDFSGTVLLIKLAVWLLHVDG